MLEVTFAGWAATVGLVIVGLLAFDLALAALRPTRSGSRGGAWSVFYIAVAVAFGVVFGPRRREFGGEYFAGYIVEKSLRSTTCSSS